MITVIVVMEMSMLLRDFLVVSLKHLPNFGLQIPEASSPYDRAHICP
jgi:hypothetical protein